MDMDVQLSRTTSGSVVGMQPDQRAEQNEAKTQNDEPGK